MILKIEEMRMLSKILGKNKYLCLSLENLMLI